MKILHIEPSRSIVALIRTVAEYIGATYTHVSSFPEAITVIKNQSFDIICAPPLVAERGCFAFFEKLTKQSAHSAANCLLYSAAPSEALKQRCEQAGISQLVDKRALTDALINYQSQLNQSQTSETTQAPEEPDDSTAAALDVIYVEDNKVLQILVKNFVSQLQNTSITLFDTGNEGLNAIKQNQPDVALLDINLPDMDGWEIAEQLRADPNTQHLSLVAVTGEIMNPQKQQKAESLFNGFIAKPFHQESINQLINSFRKTT